MLINWVFGLGVGSDALITGSMSYGHIYIYLDMIEGGFSSKTDGDSKEETIGAGIAGKCSCFSIHGGVVLKLSDCSNVCIFLTYLSR